MSKVQLSGNANGTGIFTIASPNSNTDRTLTLPDSTGTVMTTATAIALSQLPAGSVVQVVQDTFSTSYSSSTGSDVLTRQVSITPTSASNKILIISSLMCRTTQNTAGSDAFIYIKVYRGTSSGTLLINGYPVVGGRDTDQRGVFSSNYLDSPATTSSVTYSYYINSAYATSVELNSTTSPSMITLMEIKA